MQPANLQVPLTGDTLDATLLRLALRYAVAAPSSHNTQPWLFHVEDSTVELWADRSRSLAVCDPHDRELTISCGAALYQLRLAIRRFGYRPEVEVLAEPNRPDLLARVTIGARTEPSEHELMLADAVDRRRTNRGPFLTQEVKPQDLCALRDAAENEGAWLVIVPEAKRHAVAGLVADADQRQWQDPGFRRELAKWLRGNHERTAKDGIPGYAIGLGNVAAKLAPITVRTFDRGDGAAAHDVEIVEGAPVLAVLGTAHDTPHEWLTAGQALAHVLLRATTLDLAASFLNQPLEIEELRPRVTELIGVDGAPQLLLRVGFPAAPAGATPRREVEDVLR